MSVVYPSLMDKRALVTGATKGIGRDIAIKLAGSGCHISATGRDAADLSALSDEITRLDRECSTYAADLSNGLETIEMARYFWDKTGPIDILVNNAGLSFPETIDALDPEHWETTIAVNLTAPALVSSVIARGMISRKRGVIINITSQSGVVGLSEHAAYCASKFGLNGLTKVMAIELGPHNIRVNAIAPTVTLTPMGEQVWGDPAKGDPMKAKIPLGKFAYPVDVSNAVLFLASDESAMIHGEVLLIDGGFTAQ